MTPMFITLFLIALAATAAVHAAASWYEAQTRRDTQVTTDPASDHHLDKISQTARLGALGITVALLLGAFAAQAPGAVFVIVVLIFAFLRGTLAQLDRIAALASRETRLASALNGSPFGNAQMALFFSATDLAKPDHVYTWQNELDQVGVPWYCITTERQHFRALKDEGRTQAILLPNLGRGAHLLPAVLKVLYFVNNAQTNRTILRTLPRLTHVQLLHGDSDKPPSYSPLTKNFDVVFVAGQMAIDRYQRNGVHILKDRFRIVGRPQVAAINARCAPQNNERTVVYMPTWRGFFEDTQFSSLDRADAVIKAVMALPEKVHLIFKPHPLSYKDPEWPAFKARISAALDGKSAAGSTGEISEGSATPFDLYNQADLLICDISSVMIDFLYSNKPFLTILPKVFREIDRTKTPSLAASYEVASNLGNLDHHLAAALGDDPLAIQRSDVRDQAFGDLDQPPGEAFRQACRALLEEAP